MNYSNINDIIDIHKDQTIYIVGCGSELLNLPNNIKEKITKGISIGLNAVHLFLDKMTYHASGHPFHYALNCKYGNVSSCRFYQGHDIGYDYARNKSLRYHGSPQSCVHSPEFKHQISFTATNLACLMGCNNIIFVGISMKTYQHYYDLVDGMKKNMDKQAQDILDNTNNNILLEDGKQFISTLHQKRNAYNAYFADHYGRFLGEYGKLFKQMQDNGIYPHTYNQNSIIAEAGAKIISYEESI